MYQTEFFFTFYVSVKCTFCTNTYELVVDVTSVQITMSQTTKCKWFAASIQTVLHHTLSCIADTTKIGFQILKQVVVTGGQVITVCSVVLLYEARVTNNLLGIH